MQAEETTPEAMLTASPINIRQEWHNLIIPWRNATLAALPAFLISRLVLILLTYFGGILFFVPNYWTGSLSFQNILYKWYRWDVDHFISIATKGYTSTADAAFFPLYPSLMNLVSKVFHTDILLSGMIISNLAFLGALIVLYRLVETEFDQGTAKRTVLYLSIFPTAFFFFAAYNESLFLFFMLSSFYAIRRQRWWLAGLFGCIATLTRSIGLLLAVVFLYEFIRLQYIPLRQSWRDGEKIQFLRIFSGLLAVLLVPLGLGIYAYALSKRLGDPLAFSHAQVDWRQGLSFPWVAPLDGITIFLKNSLFNFFAPHLIFDLTALFLFLALIVLCFYGPERIARHQWVFAWFGLLALTYPLLFPGLTNPLPGLHDPLPSMQRFILEIFIGFIILARLGRRSWFHQGYLIISLPMLAFLTLQFMTGHWTI